MANVSKEKVVSALKTYIAADGWLERAKKKNPLFAEAIEHLGENDIYFGNAPTFIRGAVEGASTASGEKRFEDTHSQRTISIDFVTNERMFIADSNAADISVCRAAVKQICGHSDVIYKKCEARSIAFDYGKSKCARDLYDLDYNMKEYRLNRYKFVATGGEWSPEFFPIYTNLKDGNGKVHTLHLGYCYNVDGTDEIDIKIPIPMTSKNKLIMLGAIAAVAMIVILIACV